MFSVSMRNIVSIDDSLSQMFVNDNEDTSKVTMDEFEERNEIDHRAMVDQQYKEFLR